MPSSRTVAPRNLGRRASSLKDSAKPASAPSASEPLFGTAAKKTTFRDPFASVESRASSSLTGGVGGGGGLAATSSGTAAAAGGGTATGTMSSATGGGTATDAMSSATGFRGAASGGQAHAAAAAAAAPRPAASFLGTSTVPTGAVGGSGGFGGGASGGAGGAGVGVGGTSMAPAADFNAGLAGSRRAVAASDSFANAAPTAAMFAAAGPPAVGGAGGGAFGFSGTSSSTAAAAAAADKSKPSTLDYSADFDADVGEGPLTVSSPLFPRGTAAAAAAVEPHTSRPPLAPGTAAANRSVTCVWCCVALWCCRHHCSSEWVALWWCGVVPMAQRGTLTCALMAR